MRPSEALAIHRDAIRKIAESNNVRNVRVFGSVLHGTDTANSALDLIVNPFLSATTSSDLPRRLVLPYWRFSIKSFST